ncbi:nitrate- and nitrite sensing domain-containing protein [Nocardia sp. R6R-6]|uniref:nitrate- and nitrite sensing domain-containing protein n=1 Tax=Nocardia sp. R6R-6 TaxID=3459303 RepID=UPI00403D8C8C
MAVISLFAEARNASKWSDYLTDQIGPGARFTEAVQAERSASFAVAEGTPATVADLQARRVATDAGIAGIAALARRLDELNPRAVEKSNALFYAAATRLPMLRQNIDSGRATMAEIDETYTQFVFALTVGLDGLGRHNPDPAAAVEEVVAANVLQVADLHSRASGIAAAAVAGSGRLDAEQQRKVSELVGAYRQQLSWVQPRLTEVTASRWQQVTTGDDWRLLTEAYRGLADTGTTPVALNAWRDADQRLDTELVATFEAHANYANSIVADTAERSQFRSIAFGVMITLVSVAALALALRLAGGLVRRLRSLRTRSLELANEILPSIIQRINDGEDVDVDAEVAVLDPGSDEIGQVAEAFSAAQRTAMAAAAAESRTRDGFNKVFVDIAFRSQVIVRRQLDVLDLAESKQDDPEHLELLFRLDHLATRARRNAENLLILGGSQPARRWRDSVELEQIVRSAASEAEDFTRVTAIRLPAVRVLGSAVADLTHLFAELIDNATSFSPPQSPVAVHANEVGRGVAVEIEDQGLGLEYADRERINALLLHPPDFQEMALSGNRSLGLFVVGRLARRHGITVRLQESAYGGVRAIVLIPAERLDFGTSMQEPVVGEISAPLDRRAIVQAAPDPVTFYPSGQAAPRRSPISTGHLAMPYLDVPPTPDSNRHLPGAGEVGGGRNPHPGSTRAPLQRRQKQTHLVPELRVPEHDLAPPESEANRPANAVRSSMSAFQRGTRQARENSGSQSQQ